MFKNILASAIVALIVSIAVVGLVGGNHQTATSLGDATGYSALAVTGIGNSATTPEIAVAGTGTTTIALSSTATKASCIQMVNSIGSTTAMFVVGSGASTNTVTFALGTCK